MRSNLLVRCRMKIYFPCARDDVRQRSRRVSFSVSCRVWNVLSDEVIQI